MEAEGHNDQLDKFHLFTALPVELQFEIWDLWREDQPVIYHYLFLTQKGRRYAAVDANTRRIVDTTAQSADPAFDDGTPLDPEEHKIHFTNKVEAIFKDADMPRLADYQAHIMSWKFNNPQRYPHRPQLNIWVHFNKDVFIFGSFHQLPGHLRFLSRDIDAALPQNIDDDDWSHGIRRLGIYLLKYNLLHYNLPLCEFDCRAFSQLKNLRMIFLILKLNTWWLYAELPPVFKRLDKLIKLDEYIKLVDGNELHQQSEFLRQTELDVLRREKVRAEATRAQLLQILKDCNRGYISVELMVEG
ncbi:hypothetical protein F5B21DRAFT_508331 [Xylaria acuta]|nr:hypothetical protein F5B21DRAFT_508331 [Xylaria acuta]